MSTSEEPKTLELAEPEAPADQPSEEPQPETPQPSDPADQGVSDPADQNETPVVEAEQQTTEEEVSPATEPEIQPAPEAEPKAESTGKRSPTPEVASKPKKGPVEAHIDLLDGEVLQLPNLEVSKHMQCTAS